MFLALSPANYRNKPKRIRNKIAKLVILHQIWLNADFCGPVKLYFSPL